MLGARPGVGRAAFLPRAGDAGGNGGTRVAALSRAVAVGSRVGWQLALWVCWKGAVRGVWCPAHPWELEGCPVEGGAPWNGCVAAFMTL